MTHDSTKYERKGLAITHKHEYNYKKNALMKEYQQLNEAEINLNFDVKVK